MGLCLPWEAGSGRKLRLGQQERWKALELGKGRIRSEAHGLEGRLELYSVGEQIGLSVFRIGAVPAVFERPSFFFF